MSREKLMSLLGDLPSVNISAKKVAEDDKNEFILEHLVLKLNGFEPVPAFFTRPKNATNYPVCLFSHSHGGFYGMGKNELLHPAPYMYKIPYAETFAKMGIACLAIDHWCFGERGGRRESETFKSMLWRGQVMWGMMVNDSLRALDYLHTRTDVDHSRIFALGMSMGSSMSIWVSALDTRIKFCVDICCLTDFEELERDGNLDAHGIFYYVPSLRKHFEMADINGLIAPRPHFSTAGIYDNLTPVAGLKKIEAILCNKYKEAGAPDEFKLKTYPCGHLETREMREDVLQFVKERLV